MEKHAAWYIWVRYNTLYVTLSSDSLSTTKTKQPTNPELYYLVKDNVGGGLTTVVQPQPVANNIHINPDFNPERDTPRYIVKLDKKSVLRNHVLTSARKGLSKNNTGRKR